MAVLYLTSPSSRHFTVHKVPSAGYPTQLKLPRPVVCTPFSRHARVGWMEWETSLGEARCLARAHTPGRWQRTGSNPPAAVTSDPESLRATIPLRSGMIQSGASVRWSGAGGRQRSGSQQKLGCDRAHPGPSPHSQPKLAPGDLGPLTLCSAPRSPL